MFSPENLTQRDGKFPTFIRERIVFTNPHKIDGIRKP